jgi:hypothetical protein
LAAGASNPPVQPAHRRKRERSSSDAIVSDPDSDIEEVEPPKEAEVPVNVKREPSPIRVRNLRYTAAMILTIVTRFGTITGQSMSDRPRRLG